MTKNYKGIMLAGGNATRLHPATIAISKHLLPIYDKPMIYYPLSVLMLAKLQDILIITTPHDCDRFQILLGNGQKWGINLSYAIQESPNGLAQAIIIAENFLSGASPVLILGDNLYYDSSLSKYLQQAKEYIGATVFAYHVADPNRYGVVEFDKNKLAISLEEKPLNPKSNFAVTGLYFYDNNAVNYAKTLAPSHRNELEITDLNNIYLTKDKLNVVEMIGAAWLDAGTHDSLLEAGNFIRTIEHRQGVKIGCLEEIALNNGWISIDDILKVAYSMGNSTYKEYLLKLGCC